jgi:hypothetical protein
MHGCTATAKASLLVLLELITDFALLSDAIIGQAGGVGGWARTVTAKTDNNIAAASSIDFHEIRRCSDVRIAIMLPPRALIDSPSKDPSSITSRRQILKGTPYYRISQLMR